MYNDIDFEQLGKNIKKRRLELNMTQRELHELCDLSISQISTFENNAKMLV